MIRFRKAGDCRGLELVGECSWNALKTHLYSYRLRLLKQIEILLTWAFLGHVCTFGLTSVLWKAHSVHRLSSLKVIIALFFNNVNALRVLLASSLVFITRSASETRAHPYARTLNTFARVFWSIVYFRYLCVGFFFS